MYTSVLVAALHIGAQVPEEPLPTGAVARLGTTRQRSYSTSNIRYAADGKTIRTISASHRLLCDWDAATGRLLATQPIPSLGRLPIFSPDLSLAAATIDNRTLRIAQTLTGKTVRDVTLASDYGPYPVAFAPNNRLLLVTGLRRIANPNPHDESMAHIIAVAGGDPIALGPLIGQTNHARFSPDSSRVVLVNRAGGKTPDELSCWDVATGRKLWTTIPRTSYAETRFSLDGKVLIVRSGSGDHRLDRHDAATGKPLDGWDATPKGINQDLKGFSPDGTLLFCLDWNGLHAIDSATGRTRYTIPVKQGPVEFAPDGRSFVTVYRTLQRWDIATGKPLLPEPAMGHVEQVQGLIFSGDGKRLASIDADELFIWDVATCNAHPLKGLRHPSLGAFAPDHRTLYVVEHTSYGSDRVVGVDTETRKNGPVLAHSAAATKAKPWVQFGRVQVGPDGIVTIDAVVWSEEYIDDENVEIVWNPKTGKSEVHSTIKRSVRSAHARPGLLGEQRTADGKRVVAVYGDRLAVCDAATGKELKTFPVAAPDGGWTTAFVISADGTRVATVHPLGTILLWDITR